MVYYRFGPFVLDPASRLLLREEQPVPITTKVFETLVVLVENRGRVMTKDELLLRLWPDTTVEEANLAQNISTLRKALEDNPKDHRYIATIPGRGYSFVAVVTEIAKQQNMAGPSANEESPVNKSPSPAISAVQPDHGFLSRRWLKIAAGVLAISVVAVAAVVAYRWHRQQGPQEQAALTAVPFTALPGRGDFSGFLPRWFENRFRMER